MGKLLVVCLVALVACVFAHDQGKGHKGEGHQRKFTGTELALTDELATRLEAVGFRVVRPEGRSIAGDSSTYGPCGQYLPTTFPAADRQEWTTDDHVTVDVLIQDANGGGVITQYFGAGPDPAGPLLADWHNPHLRFVVPDEDNKLYTLKLQTPPERFEGAGTVQLVYNSVGRESQNGDIPPKTYFQCIDVVLAAPAAAVTASVSVFLAALSMAFLVL